MTTSLVLCANGTQDREPGWVDGAAATGAASAVGLGPDRSASGAARHAAQPGTAMWEGELPVRGRRVARALHVCERPAAGRAAAQGLRAGGIAGGGEREGGRGGRVRGGAGRDHRDQCRVAGGPGGGLGGVGAGGG